MKKCSNWKQHIFTVILCLQNNPAEARTMLLQNPQLSYALLQGLVVMRAVDPNVAVASIKFTVDLTLNVFFFCLLFFCCP